MPTKDPAKIAGMVYLVKMGAMDVGVVECPGLTAEEVRIVEAFIERLRKEEPQIAGKPEP
jgi:hypothetical protein